MAKKPNTIAEIEAEIERLKREREKAMLERATELGQLAIKLDLGAVEELVLIGAFKEIADKVKENAPAVAVWRAAGATFQSSGKRGPKSGTVGSAGSSAPAGNEPPAAGEGQT